MSTAGSGAATNPAGVLSPSARGLATAAALAAAVLALSSTGSIVVAAVLFAAATRDVRSGAAALLATLAVSLRFSTASFDDLAGIQSVLGPAGVVGPALAAASAWAAAGAVLLAARAPDVPDGDRGLWRFGPALAAGLLAATLVAGPGPSDLPVRIGASVAAVALAVASTVAGDRDRLGRVRSWLPVLLGLAAVILAGWPT